MAAYLLAFNKVKNHTLAAEYSAKAGPTVVAGGGTVVTKGQVSLLDGTFNVDAVLVARFPDIATLDRWYRSSEYQALIPLRDEALDVTFVVTSDLA